MYCTYVLDVVEGGNIKTVYHWQFLDILVQNLYSYLHLVGLAGWRCTSIVWTSEGYFQVSTPSIKFFILIISAYFICYVSTQYQRHAEARKWQIVVFFILQDVTCRTSIKSMQNISRAAVLVDLSTVFFIHMSSVNHASWFGTCKKEKHFNHTTL